MPRPRALDDVKRGEVCALVSAGCSLQTAARYVGCSTITIRREATRNADFYEQLRQAEIACQVSPLRAMRRAVDTHWRAAAWLLERTDPEQFGRRNPDHVTSDQLQEFALRMGDTIGTHITDPELLLRVCDALQAAERGFRREVRASHKTLLDPRRRRRSPRRTMPLPEDERANCTVDRFAEIKT